MSKKYDVAIIGGGFYGMLMALYMQKQGQKTCLIEQASTLGGQLNISESPFQLERKFPLCFKNDETLSALNFLNDFLDMDISYIVKTMRPLIFDKRANPLKEDSPALKPFAFYTQCNRLILSQYGHQWLCVLLKHYVGDVFKSHKVTNIEIKDKKAICCVCHNGQKIFADRFIFCISFYELQLILKNHSLLLSQQKLCKSKTLTVISIDFVHPKKIAEILDLHILLPEYKREIHPIFGLFYFLQSDQLNDHQVSQWLTFFKANTIKEEEKHTEWILKSVKKHLQTIYPHALDRLVFERLSVTQHYEHTKLKMGHKMTLPGMDNVYIPLVNTSYQSYHRHWIDCIANLKSFKI